MIQQGSRFADSATVTATVHGQDAQVIVPGAQQVQTFTFTSYQVTATDTVDALAQRFYGDPAKWWVIADANPEVMLWTQLQPGQVIRIPAQVLQ